MLTIMSFAIPSGNRNDKSAANIEGYKIAKRVAKRAVSVAKDQAYDDLYQRLGMKEGECNTPVLRNAFFA
jgi:hypothetical protein